MLTAFQANAFQNNAFQIGGSFVIHVRNWAIAPKRIRWAVAQACCPAVPNV